jgi:undecaprenyl diphosphate synthase
MMSAAKKRKKSLNSKPSLSTSSLEPSKLPSHIAIIMDGNGRWAEKRLLNRIKGHEKGSETVRTVVRSCREVGLDHLTLYAFSTENWQRPKTEVKALMSLLKRFLKTEQKELLDNNIRLKTIGQIERLPADVQEALHSVMSITQANDGMHLHLALSYGGRAEIVKMVKDIAKEVQHGKIEIDAITPEFISEHLYTGLLPDPDLLIRTGGDMRVSNFLLWQIAYTEIYVTETLWPDFTQQELINILLEYQQRERRFGKI